jgi:hypothetical protein
MLLMVGQNSAVDVDALMRQVELEFANRREPQPSAVASIRTAFSALMLGVSRSEIFLRQAQERASARMKWLEKLDRFPFNRSGKIQQAILKVMNAIFNDQRIARNQPHPALIERVNKAKQTAYS